MCSRAPGGAVLLVLRSTDQLDQSAHFVGVSCCLKPIRATDLELDHFFLNKIRKMSNCTYTFFPFLFSFGRIAFFFSITVLVF